MGKYRLARKLGTLLLIFVIALTSVMSVRTRSVEALGPLGALSLVNPYFAAFAALTVTAGVIYNNRDAISQTLSSAWNRINPIAGAGIIATWLRAAVDRNTGYVDVENVPADVRAEMNTELMAVTMPLSMVAPIAHGFATPDASWPALNPTGQWLIMNGASTNGHWRMVSDRWVPFVDSTPQLGPYNLAMVGPTMQIIFTRTLTRSRTTGAIFTSGWHSGNNYAVAYAQAGIRPQGAQHPTSAWVTANPGPWEQRYEIEGRGTRSAASTGWEFILHGVSPHSLVGQHTWSAAGLVWDVNRPVALAGATGVMPVQGGVVVPRDAGDLVLAAPALGSNLVIPTAIGTSGSITIPDIRTVDPEAGVGTNPLGGLFGLALAPLYTVLQWIQALLAAFWTTIVSVLDTVLGRWIPAIPAAIGRMFSPLLALLIALIALFGRVFVFLLALMAIPPDSSGLPANVLAGLAWARSIEFREIGLIAMLTGAANVVFGVIIFRGLRRIFGGV